MSEESEKVEQPTIEKPKSKRRRPLRRRRKDLDQLGQTNDEIFAMLEARGAKKAEFNHVVFTKANLRYDYTVKKWLVWHDKYRTPTKGDTWGRTLFAAYTRTLRHVYAATLTVHAFRRAVKHLRPGRGGAAQVVKLLASDKTRDQDVADFRASLVPGQQVLSSSPKDPTVVVAFPPLNSLMSMEFGGLVTRGCQGFVVAPPASEPWWGFLPGVIVIEDARTAAAQVEACGMPLEATDGRSAT